MFVVRVFKATDEGSVAVVEALTVAHLRDVLEWLAKLYSPKKWFYDVAGDNQLED